MDMLALLCVFAAWIGYSIFAHRRSHGHPSLLGSTNRERRQWMWRATRRDNRLFDGAVVQNLSTSPSFFASTTILIIGGLVAVLGASNQAEAFMRELPFAARTSMLIFDLKLVIMLGMFVFAFFRFTWSMRQYGFGTLMLASAPLAEDPYWTDATRDAFADRAGRVMGLAAESFNDGLRTYYMSFAVMAWFVSPLTAILATVCVVWVLYQREFQSEMLALLNR